MFCRLFEGFEGLLWVFEGLLWGGLRNFEGIEWDWVPKKILKIFEKGEKDVTLPLVLVWNNHLVSV